MSYLIVLPAIDRELTERCVASLEKHGRDRLLLIDNSSTGFAAGWPVDIVRPTVNLGVARSWNIGLGRVLDEGHDYLVLLSAATEFGVGGWDSFASHLDEGLDARGVQNQEGWHCLALGRPLLEACGPFDENFWPAYLDDIDYLRRMALSGLWDASDRPLPQVSLDATRWGDAHGMIKAGVQVNFAALLGYYRTKWGGNPREEEWELPFGDRPLGYWPEASVEDLAVRYGLNLGPISPAQVVDHLVGR